MRIITNWLDDHQLISVHGLEKKLGIVGSIKNARLRYRKEDAGEEVPDSLKYRGIKDDYLWPICRELSRYGLELGEHRFRYDENIDAFFIECFTGAEPETEESEDGRYFTYHVPMYRDIISDETDLIEFLGALEKQNAI